MWNAIAEKPKKSGFYLMAAEDGRVNVGRYLVKKDEWKLPAGWLLHLKATHWAKLPAPPQACA